MRHGVEAVKAGLDIAAPFQNVRARSLKQGLAAVELTWSDVKILDRGIIDTQLRHYSSRIPKEADSNIPFCQNRKILVRDVATKAIVLLKNNEVKLTAYSRSVQKRQKSR